MKTSIKVLMLALIILPIGIILGACGNKTKSYTVTLNYTVNDDLFNVNILETSFSYDDNNPNTYTIKKGNDFIVAINAQPYADCSNMIITINNQNQAIPSPIVYDDGSAVYNLGVQSLQSDLEINISGITAKTYSFNLGLNNSSDPDVQEKAKMMSIYTDGQWKSFWSIITSNNKVITVDYPKNGLGILKVRFDGIAPFANLDSMGSITPYEFYNFVSFQKGNATPELRSAMSHLTEGIYEIVFNGIADGNNNVNFNFDNLFFIEFGVTSNQSCESFSLTQHDSFTYKESAIITINKLKVADGVDYSNLGAYIGNTALEKVQGTETDSIVQFIIPKNKTPNNYGVEMIYNYNVTVKGVDYSNVSLFKLSVSSQKPMVMPQEIYLSNNKPYGYDSNGNSLHLSATECTFQLPGLLDGTYQDLNYNIIINETHVFNPITLVQTAPTGTEDRFDTWTETKGDYTLYIKGVPATGEYHVFLITTFTEDVSVVYSDFVLRT